MKIEEFEKKVQELDFLVYCIIMKKTSRHAWIKPVFTDREGRLMDVPVYALADKIGLKAEWGGAKGCEVKVIKVPRWDRYSFDGYVLAHLILERMCPRLDDRHMDVREFCWELT